MQRDDSTANEWARRYEHSLHEEAVRVEANEDREASRRVLFIWMFVGLLPAAATALLGDGRSLIARLGSAVGVGLAGLVISVRLAHIGEVLDEP